MKSVAGENSISPLLKSNFISTDIDSSFFIGIIYTGDDIRLRTTLNSVLRQQKDRLAISPFIFYPEQTAPKIDMPSNFTLVSYGGTEDFFKKLVASIEKSASNYCTIAPNGAEFFDGAFASVRDIFRSYDEINWITGIQTFKAPAGFNISWGNTALRRWSHKIYERSLYKNSGRQIASASTFWRKSVWPLVVQDLHFVNKQGFLDDLWEAFFRTQKLYTCKIYFSGADDPGKLITQNFKQPNQAILIESSFFSRVKEFLFVNNVPYLRVLYRREGEFSPIIRFDHNTQSYFLSAY